LLSFSFVGNSQNDTIVISFKDQFRKNSNELGALYCWSDINFYPGIFQFKKVEKIRDEFENLNFSIFTDLSSQTEEYYLFLEGLDLKEKQNLIRFYSFYENLFETTFKESGLPQELKYLAPALTAMNGLANGEKEKAGVWQLSHFQAVLNGLTVSKIIDERLNISRSTQAFAEVLKQNYQSFKSTELAVFAYMCGNTKVKNGISALGGEASSIQILNSLPYSIKNKIAAFQAMAIFLNSNLFKPEVNILAKNMIPDTVKVHEQLHFQQITEVLDIPLKQLQFLNPEYKYSLVPVNGKVHRVAVPREAWDDFVLFQDSIYSAFDSSYFQITAQKIEYPPAPNRQYLGEPVKDLEIEGKTKIKYRIKTGDVLGIIAEEYDVRVADLKYWNNISNERKIQAGKTLDIFVDDDKADYYVNLGNIKKNKKRETKVSMPEQLRQSSTLDIFEELKAVPKIEHIVKSGESPFTIAKKYSGVTPDEILEWNNISDARKIQIGQKLIIYIKQ